jgi:hypothetical protein
MKTLAKFHGSFVGTRTAGVWTLDALTDGWVQGIGPGYTDTFTSSTYFDLAGMSMEEKTLFFEAATVQQAGFTSIGSAAGDSVLIYDIMTSIPIDINKNDVQDDIVQRGLGFPGAKLNYEHVLYQRMQRFSLDVDYAAKFPVLAESHQSGSLMPTASDRIYSYRLLQFLFVGDGAGIIPPVRHLINVKPAEEATYEYMMRLKRSYDLQQEPDRD